MSDEKDQKVEESAEETVEVKEEAKKSAEKAEESADKAKEAVEEAKEVKEEKVSTITPKADVGKEKSSSAKATADKPAPSGKYKEIIEKIENLSVLELAELVKDLEDRFGVSAAVVAAPTSGAVGAPIESVGEEEKSSYDVVLASGGDKKIQVIKAVREIKPDLGLKEAKDLVDGAPKELAKGMKKEEAEEAKQKLEAAGATVELK